MSMTVFGALRRLDQSRFRAELYRGWNAGLGAGLAHSVALEQIGRIDSAWTEELRRYLVVGAQQGRAVGAAVKARPNLFDPFEAAILSAGDAAGTLDKSLRILTDHFAREYKRMLRIRLQMGYLLFFGLIASFVITIPFLHRGGWVAYMIAIALALAGLMLLGGTLISIVAGIISGGAAFTLPRFVRALVAGAEAGLPIGRTVRLAVDVSGSAVLRMHLAKRSERELGTTPLAMLFEGCRKIPPGLIGQMRVADATGDYLFTLKRYADELEEKQK
jgi:type II secretory pathway component PulF